MYVNILPYEFTEMFKCSLLSIKTNYIAKKTVETIIFVATYYGLKAKLL